MGDAQPEAAQPLAAAAPALRDKAERGAALVQAVVFERRELVYPGQEKRGTPARPGVVSQPVASLDGLVQAAVAGVGEDAEGGPYHHVPGDEERRQEAAVAPPPGHGAEHRDQGQARRQHHREGHQRPAADEGERDQGRVAAQAHLDLAELFVAQEPPVWRLAPGQENEPGEYDEPYEGGGERPTVVYPGPPTSRLSEHGGRIK